MRPPAEAAWCSKHKNNQHQGYQNHHESSQSNFHERTAHALPQQRYGGGSISDGRAEGDRAARAATRGAAATTKIIIGNLMTR